MSKNTLIILPGWGGSKETWQGFLDFINKKPFDEEIEIKIVNLPCFGDEPCPDEVWGIKEYAHFVETKIKDELELDKVYLLGHSFGGAVAAKVAEQNPDLVNKLILSGPAILRPKKKFKRIFFKFLAKAGKIFFKLPVIEKFDTFGKKVLYKIADSPDYPDTSGIKRDIFKKIVKEDLSYILPDIKTPTLVVWGEEDRLVDLKNSLDIVPKIKDCRLRVIKEGRHGLHLHKKEELRDALNSFLC